MTPEPLDVELEDPPKTRLVAFRRKARDWLRGKLLDLKHGRPDSDPEDDWDPPIRPGGN